MASKLIRSCRMHNDARQDRTLPEQAAKYIARAEGAADLSQNGKLIDMADTWLRLAEQAEQFGFRESTI